MKIRKSIDLSINVPMMIIRIVFIIIFIVVNIEFAKSDSNCGKYINYDTHLSFNIIDGKLLFEKDSTRDNQYRNNRIFDIKHVKDTFYKISSATKPSILNYSDVEIRYLSESNLNDSIRIYLYLPNYNSEFKLRIFAENYSNTYNCDPFVNIIKVPKSLNEFMIEISPKSYDEGCIDNQYLGILYCTYHFPINTRKHNIVLSIRKLSPSYFYDVWIDDEFIKCDNKTLIWNGMIFYKE